MKRERLFGLDGDTEIAVPWGRLARNIDLRIDRLSKGAAYDASGREVKRERLFGLDGDTEIAVPWGCLAKEHRSPYRSPF